MLNEEEKRKLENVISRLYSINSKINSLNDNFCDINEIINNNIQIDSKFDNCIAYSKKQLSSCQNQILQNIIPRLNNKIKDI